MPVIACTLADGFVFWVQANIIIWSDQWALAPVVLHDGSRSITNRYEINRVSPESSWVQNLKYKIKYNWKPIILEYIERYEIKNKETANSINMNCMNFKWFFEHQ